MLVKLYRQSGRRRSAKLVPTFAGRGVSRGQRNGSPRPLSSVGIVRSWTNATEFSFSFSLAIQAIIIHKYRSLRTKLMKCNANIYFNKQCLNHKVIPANEMRSDKFKF
jgi:hypothetical protein